MTREECVAIEASLLKQLNAPEEVRGGDGSGVRMRSVKDILISLGRIRAEIAAIDEATGGGNSGTITRLYSGTGL